MRWLAVLAMLAACQGQSGTISVQLTTAPGSTVLDPVTKLRLTVTHPHGVFEANRTASGFDLSIALDATGESGEMILEGFDAAGALVATGMAPAFPFAAVDTTVVIYVAPPMSIAAAPVALTPARTELAASPLPYGAIFAGGRDAAGAPSDAISVYNVYDHSLRGGMPMPVARAGLVMAVNIVGGVYLFGGTGADGNVSGNVFLFDSTVAPNGSYTMIGDEPGFARANQIAVRTGSDRFLLTGAPVVELVGGLLSARTEIASLPAVGTTVTPMDGIITAVFADAADIIRFRNGSFDVSGAGQGRDRAGIAALPDGHVAIVGGGTASTARDLLVLDPATGTLQAHPAALITGRFAPAVAATARHLVIIGGVDDTGVPVATAEVLDATTFAPLAVIPIQPRAGTFAFPLPNGQVLIAGGSPASDLLELFTPDPPPL
jgi:hypothetical protein